MFRRLSHRLTVLYAGLFCAALIVIGATVYGVIAASTERLAREQMARAAALFTHTTELQTQRLRASATAAATPALQHAVLNHDDTAIRSALSALRAAAGAELAFVVTREGLVVGEQASVRSSVPPGLQQALATEAAPAGLITYANVRYQAATAPIPGANGFIVLGAPIEGEITALESLATLPLEATALTRTRSGWSAGADGEALATMIDRQLQHTDRHAEQIVLGDDRALILATPLPSLDSAPTALVLRYQLSGALSPYGALFSTLFLVGCAGLALLVAGTWFLARGITRPISTLEVAARKLKDGVFESVVVDSKDEVAQLAESFNAMTAALRERERKITQLAYHDAETRLPNRLALERRLTSAPQPERVYLVAIGVDRFADVRGAIGYTLTGVMMRTLGQRLSQLVPNAPVARLSSDVLGVALLADSDADSRKRADALIQALEQPLSLEGHDLDVHISIGIAQPRAKAESPSAMIERASVALDQARGARQKVGLFDEAAYGDPARNLSLMSEMRRAIESDSLSLVHQPKYDFRNARIEAAEALVRWRHPTRGMIAPDLFIPMAEETGHIRALTEWVLKRAITDQKKFSAAGYPLTLSVNISGRLLGDDDFARTAVALVREAPHKLCFEITETAVIDNPKAALENIERFAANGVGVSIDDYGSGLSSLAYLKQLPAHELKIDKLFIESITNSQRDALLVRSTIDLAHGLGLAVVAEGVETPSAFALLASMRCDLAQGYLIARPSTVDELIAILSDERRMRHYQQAAAGSAGAPPPKSATRIA